MLSFVCLVFGGSDMEKRIGSELELMKERVEDDGMSKQVRSPFGCHNPLNDGHCSGCCDCTCCDCVFKTRYNIPTPIPGVWLPHRGCEPRDSDRCISEESEEPPHEDYVPYLW